MKIHDLIQGSPEWLAYRATMRNASDAPAMMGCSAYKTRAELLREMHTGVAAEVDIGTQMRFDNGHRAEALARPLAEEFIGAELYPVTGSLDSYSASFDGVTLAEDECFEHKALNDALRAAFADMLTIAPEHQERASGRCLPLMYRVQMEQQLLVSGANRVLFMASAWTPDDELIEERHCWYYPDAKLRQQITDGWLQFDRDLDAYSLPPATEPAPVGKAPDSLPALRIELTGQVTASNLAEFKTTALAAIRGVNRNLKTDADFADAEKAVKWCSDVEARLKAAKDHALSQTSTIDELFRALDEIAAESKAARLDLDKLVTRRKGEVKDEAVAAARRALDLHIAAVNAEVAPMHILPVAADFAAAIKGKRSIDSMQDALDTTLAAAKIAADAQGRHIRANVSVFKAATGDDGALLALFADLGQMVHKPADDFALLVGSRIKAHNEAEAAREAARQAAEAQRIAQAEQRAREQEAARIAEQQRQQAEAERQAAAALAAAAAPAPAPVSEPARPASPPMATLFAPQPDRALFPVHPLPTAARASVPASAEPVTLNLGAIGARLGFALRADFLADVLHIEPAAIERGLPRFRESDFVRICAALIEHVENVQMLQAA